MPTPRPDDLASRFGRRVRQLRVRGGWSQEAFALAVGMGRSHYSRVERGVENVSLSTIQRIADGLGIEPVVLFRFPKARTR